MTTQSALDSHHLVTLAMKAVEGLVGGTDIGYTLHFKEPVDCEALQAAYAEAVESEPSLRSVMRYDSASSRWRWVELEEERWRPLLAAEEASLSVDHPLAQLASTWRKLESDLPVRLYRLGDRRFYLTVQHALTDAVGGLLWMARLLERYAHRTGNGAAVRPRRAPRARRTGDPLWKRALWLAVFLAKRLSLARLHHRRVVDLTEGATVPPANDKGYTLEQLVLAGRVLSTLKARAWQERLTVTQLLLGLLSEVLFERSPAGAIARIGLPMDLRPESPLSPERAATLNFVQAVPIELRAGRAWRAQIPSEFLWLRRGMAPMLGALITRAARTKRDEAEVVRWLCGHLRLRHADPGRGYFRQWTCLFSSIEGLPDPILDHYLSAASLHGKFEFLGFGVVATESTLVIDAMGPNHLYPPEVARRLLGGLARRIEGLAGGTS